MSGYLVGQVYLRKCKGPKQAVLVALAEHGHDDGTSIYPGVPYLAWKLDCSERQVQRHLRELEESGVLVPVANKTGGRGRKTEYRIALSALPMKDAPPKTQANLYRGGGGRNGDVLGNKSAPQTVTSKVMSSFINGDIQGHQTVTFTAPNGDILKPRAHNARTRGTVSEPSNRTVNSGGGVNLQKLTEAPPPQNNFIDSQDPIAKALRQVCQGLTAKWKFWKPKDKALFREVVTETSTYFNGDRAKTAEAILQRFTAPTWKRDTQPYLSQILPQWDTQGKEVERLALESQRSARSSDGAAAVDPATAALLARDREKAALVAAERASGKVTAWGVFGAGVAQNQQNQNKAVAAQ